MDWADRVGSRIKLRDLHILLAVVEWKSMAEAARRLAVRSLSFLEPLPISNMRWAYACLIARQRVSNQQLMVKLC